MTDDPRTLRLASLLAVVVLAWGLQHLRPFRGAPANVSVNSVFFVLGGLVSALVCGLCMVVAAAKAEQAGVGLFNVVHLPSVVVYVATIAGLDLVSYWWHRANHAVAFFWRFHRVHHSDTSLTISTAARFHPGELLLSFPLRLAGIVALGAPVAAVVTFEIVFNAFNYFEHADIDEGAGLQRVLGAVFIVPALHRRHHCDEPSSLHSNFGTVFSLWDRVFRTFGSGPPAGGFRPGLPGQKANPGLSQALAMPFEP